MEENDKKNIWWVSAVSMFARVSTWVFSPIIIALFLGKFFDKRYSTTPWIFLSSMIVAFTISLIAIWNILVKYIQKIEKEVKDKNDKTNNK